MDQEAEAPAVAPDKCGRCGKPKEPQPPSRCGACDRILVSSNPTLSEAQASDTFDSEERAVAHDKYRTTGCVDCVAIGFVPPKPVRRRDAVIENCEFYVATGIGLTEAAAREGYSDRSHLDSVLRRWQRLDLSHALSANDPAQVRDRPWQ